jgi:hypothetical protein
MLLQSRVAGVKFRSGYLRACFLDRRVKRKLSESLGVASSASVHAIFAGEDFFGLA